MKKNNLLFIFLLAIYFFLGQNVYASSCEVVSGDGTNIGDEISCGTGNFYVLSNDGENIKMLSKYNLYVGMELYYFEFDDPIMYTYYYGSGTGYNYVYNDVEYDSYDSMLLHVLEENGYDSYDYVYNHNYDYYSSSYDSSTSIYTYTYILNSIKVYNDLSDNAVLQNSLAIGAHGDTSGDPEYPEVGVVSLNYFDYYSNSVGNYRDTAFDENEIYSEGYLDLNLTTSFTITDSLVDYEDSLSNLGLTVNDISILGVSDINNIVYNVTGSYLPLSDWWNTSWEYDTLTSGYKVGSISDYLGDDYSWLWSTTYWTKTVAGSKYQYVYFVDTLGDLCADYACLTSVGAGIRPVVTISTSDLVYNIVTKTDGNGTVEASTYTSPSGKTITFTVTPNDGYTLKKLTVTDSSGNSVTFTDYTFTMPASDVTIYAEFVKTTVSNPNTGLSISLFGIVLFGMGCIMLIKIRKNKYL